MKQTRTPDKIKNGHILKLGWTFWEDHIDRLACDHDQSEKGYGVEVVGGSKTFVYVACTDRSVEELLEDSLHYGWHMDPGYTPRHLISAGRRTHSAILRQLDKQGGFDLVQQVWPRMRSNY